MIGKWGCSLVVGTSNFQGFDQCDKRPMEVATRMIFVNVMSCRLAAVVGALDNITFEACLQCGIPHKVK